MLSGRISAVVILTVDNCVCGIPFSIKQVNISAKKFRGERRKTDLRLLYLSQLEELYPNAEKNRNLFTTSRFYQHRWNEKNQHFYHILFLYNL